MSDTLKLELHRVCLDWAAANHAAGLPVAIGQPYYLVDVLLSAIADWNRRAPGYREGAEAMREAAALEVDCGCECRSAVLAATTSIARTYACGRDPCCASEAAAIRALPLPEEPK